MQFRVAISAQQLGAIGKLGTERRTYNIEAENSARARDLAIEKGSRESLQHVRVERVEPDWSGEHQETRWDR